MAKSNISKASRRQSAKTDKSTAAKLARQRKTAENKARRMLATLKRSGGRDMGTADALVDLVARFPHLKNLKLG
jgi:hypothetical protein